MAEYVFGFELGRLRDRYRRRVGHRGHRGRGHHQRGHGQHSSAGQTSRGERAARIFIIIFIYVFNGIRVAAFTAIHRRFDNMAGRSECARGRLLVDGG